MLFCSKLFKNKLLSTKIFSSEKQVKFCDTNGMGHFIHDQVCSLKVWFQYL